MVLYKVFYKNGDRKKGELLGVLPERREDLRGMGPIESALTWARSIFGGLVKDEQAIFIRVKDYKM